MNIEEVLENIKRHLDYVNATKQKSIRDTEIEVMYKEIERLNNIINKALRKLRASKDHFKTENENNAVTFTIKILEESDNND